MNLARSLEDIHRLINRQWAIDSARLGISHSEFEYLRAVRDHETDRVCQDEHSQHLQDIVEVMGIRKASASAMIAKLEKRGFVKRVPCRLDARAQHILLTGKGSEALRAGEDVYRAAARALRAQIGGESLSRLEAALDTENANR
ncbi:MarR family transcriptional regulator [Nitratireductor sp. XY-223]|uniref:MarR family winged helix-turn-helix transcriptional regulator n=1 Tax=Nitratireductor sp. XY-223 TaxID=2561926 RepID=UPI0010AA4F6A|nr:MarR family transcriptional regulator [Nitratireductor sp. XY-223]